ncbi:hypothetical protein V1506DRAFT_555826 [Lipomyces tetrasporus]
MLNSSSEFTEQTTNLSSTGAMLAVTPTDMEYPPEQRLDIRLPYCQYRKLEESWSKFKSENNIQEEKRYPSLSYNSLMQIATVVTTQSALHDRTGTVFREIIASSINEYLSMHKPNVMDTIEDYGSMTVSELSLDDRSMSSKEADETFVYERPGKPPCLQVVIECGVSENYKALCRDKDLWIQHLGAKAVVLICLKEAPRFKTSRAVLENIKYAVAEVERMEQHAARAMALNLEQGHFGPIEYRNHTWVGKVNELFVEVWRADEKSPVRKTGTSYNCLIKTTGLKISDFFPEDEWTAFQIPESNVCFPPHLFDKLMSAMTWTARTRFVRFLNSLGLRKG